MGVADWLRPPRRTLAIFLGLIFILGGSLGWLGWQWLKQDRALERQRVQESLEQSADRMAASLSQSLAGLESYLNFVPAAGAKMPPAGALALRVSKSESSAYPPGVLLFLPFVSSSAEAPASTFAAGEILEFQRNDPAAAAEAFRPLARSPDPAVRAGALLRLGRNLRKAGRPREALDVYDKLSRLGQTSVQGLPAELTARVARATVLEGIGDLEALGKEAALLNAGLWSGRWSLRRPAWEYHREEARRWLGATAPTGRERSALALSLAAESVYRQWAGDPESKGRRLEKFEDRPVLAAWSGTAESLAAVLAGPDYLGAVWAEALRSRDARGALVDGDGQVVLGELDHNGPQAVRTTAVTKLPVTLLTTRTDPAAADDGAMGRRRLLYGGFAVLALVLLSGSYFIMRSINREQAVARLQSEFVSAVSHEFRTPLTSLRQLSEMLAKGRVPTEDLRRKSYDILAQESERLQRLVESLLDFGRLEASAYGYRFERLEPAAFVAGVVAEFQDKVAAQGYRVDLTVLGEAPPIRADREALGLALRNILDNAVKYSPDCRSIWVETKREGELLAIRVRDQGLGIPASEQKRIFDKFVRGAGSRTAGIQGTGIGLAMALRIVEDHGGEIRLASEPGKGSAFTVLLPLEKRT